MAGQIKHIIDQLIQRKAKGDHALEYLMHAKLALKGINVKNYDLFSEDDPIVIAKLRQISKDFGVSLEA